MKQATFLFPLCLVLSMCGIAGQKNKNDATETIKASPNQLDKLSVAYFASGCFWCVEAIFESVKGVEEAESGYSGGTQKKPTYRQVSAGQTSHTEAVKVYYDPKVVSYETLIKVYYGSHDPTTVNGQSPDFGIQYRSMIFYQNDTEKLIAISFKDSLDQSGVYDQPIATEIVPYNEFWMAEDYHQDFEKKNPNQPYVRSVSIPRLKKFQAKFPELIKQGH